MSDARASAPWETIRSGLRLLAGGWGVQIGFTVLNRIFWVTIFSALTPGSTSFAVLMKVIGVFSFLTEAAFASISVTLAMAAARLRRFPLVVREVTPADPYRGARDAGPARAVAVDGLAIVVVAALGSTAALGLATYVYNTLFSADYVPGRRAFGVHEALWMLVVAAALVAGAAFTIWASRAARAASRAISPALTIASLVALALRAAFEGWEIVVLLQAAHPSWAPWVGLGIECASTGLLILIALQGVDALREQPRSHGG